MLMPGRVCGFLRLSSPWPFCDLYLLGAFHKEICQCSASFWPHNNLGLACPAPWRWRRWPYLVGRQGRRPAPAGQADLEQALDDARRLERITDEMLVATRQALNHCQQLKIHYPSRQSAVDAVFAND
jgi:hypothetical protein